VTSPVVAPGSLVADRYRLEEPLVAETDGWISLWRAVDAVLARPVAVRMLDSGDERASDLLAAARAAGRVSDAALARVYDAGEDGTCVYVVIEWLEESLEQRLLRGGSLDPATSVDLLIELSRAVTVAHQAGLCHQHLRPSNVMFTSDGAVRLTGLATASALDGRRSPIAADGVAYDVRGLGLLLYAALTSRWPGDPADSKLPEAPWSDTNLHSPGQVRAGIPRDLDLLTIALLPEAQGYSGHMGHLGMRSTPVITSAAELEMTLASLRLSGELQQASAAGPFGVARGVQGEEDADTRGFWARLQSVPRVLRIGIPVALAALIGTAIWAGASQLGVDSFPDHQPKSSTTVPTGATGVLRPAAVHDFDPEADGKENPQQVKYAYDGNPDTAWHTETYRTAEFGNLKSGLGLVVDLGQPEDVVTVDLTLLGDGTDLELRAGDTEPTTGDSLPVVAKATDGSGTIVLHPAAGTKARYWVIWLTKLPAVSDGFRGGIAEMSFER
jgi:hypothetical protein